MIAKVPAKRNDGRSSFASLGRYLAGEKIDRDTGEIVRTDEDIHLETNCLSVKTASAEMRAVADQNARVKDPVYHCILSWREGEQPTNDQIHVAAMEAMEAIGMQDHQYVLAAHRDSDNTHVQLMINRVNPETYKAVYPKQDFMKLDRCMRDTELQQGWQHDNGPYAIVDGQIVRAQREQEAQPLPTKARDMEAATGCESLLTYAQQVSGGVVAALERRSWQELHAALHAQGLGIREAGQGFKIHDLHNPKTTPIKASDMAGELGGGKLKKLLGAYEKPLRIIQQAKTPEQIYNPFREKMQAGRDERREARAAARLALRERFDLQKLEHAAAVKVERQRMRDAEAQVLKSLSERARAERSQIKSAAINPAERQAKLSILAMRVVQEREALAAARKARRAAERHPGYREWCAIQAVAGDAAAIAQLKGWEYQESRRRKTAEKAEKAAAERGAIRAALAAYEPPAKPSLVLDDVTWQVDRRTGDVTYRLHGVDALRDTGRQVSVLQPKDDKSIEAGLRLAGQKFGPQLTLTGPIEFQQRCIQIAVEKGLGVRFSDPAAEAYRVQLEQARKLNHHPSNMENHHHGNQPSNSESEKRIGKRVGGQGKNADSSPFRVERVHPVSVRYVVRGQVADSDKAGGALHHPERQNLGWGR